MQRFCPRCGTRLMRQEKAEEVLMVCPRCGFRNLLGRRPRESRRGPPTAEDFENTLLKWLREAKEAGREYIDVRAGDLHRKVGGYPGPDHRMPLCCDVMRRLMGPEDMVLEEPPSGYGANLVIRYYLSRRDL